MSHSQSTTTGAQLVAWIIKNENDINQNDPSKIIDTREEVNTLLKQTLKKYYQPVYFKYYDEDTQKRISPAPGNSPQVAGAF